MAALRRPWVIVLGSFAVVVAALVGIYAVFFTPDSPPPLQLSAVGSAATAPAAVSTTTGATPASVPTTASAAAVTTVTTARSANSTTSTTSSPAASTTSTTRAPSAGAASPATNATTTAAVPAGPVPTAADPVGVWKVSSGSLAGYRVRERFVGFSADSDAVGRTTDVTGSATIARAGEALTVTAARFDVNLQRLASDDGRRDNRIRTQGLESSRFPTSTFVLTAPIALPADATNGKAFAASATGDLTLHGVTKRVTMPLEVRMNPDGRIEAVGSLKFPMSDFAIDPPNVGGFVTVSSDATLEVQLFLAP